ncbi:SPOR domain-containing protein [Roseovarius sp. A21]|uniref:SPOR domain-containing protein n=1 Tax=Roseovarius bejariae TaxID=2576383 RepID=A0A844CV34_9RHOB|nr:SPOR domain-containing protein [Roseovarius bejariae]MRU13974.1 SPOR domain-containing protein [Roseovarius bejariae]
MADMHGAQHGAVPEQNNGFARMANLAGAAVSLALIVGIGVWGYKILVRDVSGVPVVRAAEGPMRIQPDDPGGRQALNQGLAVNEVAAEGTAAGPVEQLILAPEPLDLTLEDTPPTEVAAAPEDEITPTAEAAEPLSAEDEAVQLAAVEALANELTDGVAPLEELAPAEDDTPEATAEPAVAEGLGVSLRPKLRPAGLSNVRQVAAVATSDGPRDVDPDSIPAGTRLAQLGAYASAEVARKEWTRLSGRFEDYLQDKDRVIQKAQSGGRTFYRLRAMGFDDLSDARRFCSALVAENAECIPVVTR